MTGGTATLVPEAAVAPPLHAPLTRATVAAGRSPRIGRGSRLAAAVAALALGALYLTPLWHIGLTAPQYPEGLGMYIWVSRITGEKPQDLNSINGLNHYIGMKMIVPESIPELRLLPVVVAAAIVVGLVVALLGRRRVLYAWTAVFAAASAAGLADFWRWGYDYGHNLDPHAAIKIPGMTYQPPLLGDKQLLNFHAASWPATGGWIAILVLAALVALSVREWRSARSLAG